MLFTALNMLQEHKLQIAETVQIKKSLSRSVCLSLWYSI